MDTQLPETFTDEELLELERIVVGALGRMVLEGILTSHPAAKPLHQALNTIKAYRAGQSSAAAVLEAIGDAGAILQEFEERP